jgi:hypothetical protein
MVQIQLVMAWFHAQTAKLQNEDGERGDGILIWVVMVALLAAAAIAIVAIIVNKATDTANNIKTQ